MYYDQVGELGLDVLEVIEVVCDERNPVDEAARGERQHVAIHSSRVVSTGRVLLDLGGRRG